MWRGKIPVSLVQLLVHTTTSTCLFGVWDCVTNRKWLPPTLADPQPGLYTAPPMQPMHGYTLYDPHASAPQPPYGPPVVVVVVVFIQIQ